MLRKDLNKEFYNRRILQLLISQALRISGGPLRNECFLSFSLKEGEDQKEIKIEPAQAVDEVEPLPEDYYTRPVNLTEGNILHYFALFLLYI